MTLRLWPDSLFGRLVVTLAAGMFAGQLLTSTIWFDTHDYRTLEIPSRLFASRLADTIRLLRNAPDAATREATLARLSDARYQLRPVDTPEPARAAPNLVLRATGGLIAGVIERRLGQHVELRLLDAELRDDAGRHRGILSLFDSRMPMGDFHLQLQVPGQGWLDVVAHEGQAGMHSEPGTLVADYLLRLYLVRFAAVCLLAFVAVRFALRPLRSFAKAAEALGRNIYQAPLAVDGPQEVRSAAKAFNAMQQRLIDSFGERTRLLSAVSHDLRSPLTRLRLRAEMLPDPRWRERLRGDLDEMEAMVRATLDAVQGIEITEPRQRIDIDSMLAGLAEDARDAGHAVRIEGHAGAPYPGVRAQPEARPAEPAGQCDPPWRHRRGRRLDPRRRARRLAAHRDSGSWARLAGSGAAGARVRALLPGGRPRRSAGAGRYRAGADHRARHRHRAWRHAGAEESRGRRADRGARRGAGVAEVAGLHQRRDSLPSSVLNRRSARDGTWPRTSPGQ